MEQKILKSIIAIVSCSIILTGCFPTPQDSELSVNNNNSSQSVSTVSEKSGSEPFSSHITDNETEMLNIDADIIFPEGFNAQSEVSSAKTHYKKWDGEAVVSALTDGRLINAKTITDTEIHENTGQDDLLYSYTLDDGSSAAISAGNIIYRTELLTDCLYTHFFDYYENFLYEDSMENIFGSDDIEGISKSQAIEETGKVISITGLDAVTGEPEIYSMTYDKIQAIINTEGHLTDKYGEQLTEINGYEDAYLIIYPVKYNGIPSSKVMAMGENEIFGCSKTFFIYSRSGIIGFELTGIFEEADIIQSGTLLSPEAACNILKDFYSNVILDSPENISLIKLVFINRQDIYTDSLSEYILEPFWLIYGSGCESKSGSKTETRFIKFISALNGEMIPSVSIGG